MASLAIDTLWYSDKNYRIIGKVTESGLRTEFFDTDDSGIRDLAWDGTYIWSISFDGTVKKFSTSGDEIDSYPELLAEGWGLTFDGMYIWASDPSTDQIYQLSFPGLGDFIPPAAPALSSGTHPSENVWYSHDSPRFDWTEPVDPSGISGYSFWLNHLPATEPDTLSDGTSTSVNFSGLADGIWYFHCRARDGAGNWGSSSHYQIKIDTEAPPPPVNVTVIPEGWSPVNLFQITWSYPQDNSSIVGSYFKMGIAPLHETDGALIQASQLILSVPQEGIHSLYIWLEDGAGNIDHNAHHTTTLSYDATGPSEGTISVNEDAEMTVSGIVTLTNLGAVDEHSGMGFGAQMRFSNDGTTWSPAEGYSGHRVNWDLSSYGGTGDPGQKTVFVQYQDAAGNWSDSFFDTIILAASLVITTDSLPGGAVGLAYQETLAVSGGVPPYTWRLSSGELPHNLTLDHNGVISGIPDEPGTSIFWVNVIDSFSNSEFKAFSITTYAGSMLGDLNGDGRLNLFDALLVVQYIIGLEDLTLSQRWAANVVDDGIINIADVVAIAHLIVGLSPGVARTSASSAVLSMHQSPPLADGSVTMSISLENAVSICGLQFKLLLPSGAHIRKPPRLAEHWASFNLNYAESNGLFIVLIYSLKKELASSAPGPIFHLELSLPNTAPGKGPGLVQEVIAVDEDALLIPVSIEPPLDSPEPISASSARSHPNPFNPETSITFTLQKEEFISVIIYDILGRNVQTVAETEMKEGVHEVQWDGNDRGGKKSPSGTYFCRIEGESISQTLKLILIR